MGKDREKQNVKPMSILTSILYDAVLVNVATILAFLVRFSGRIPAVNFRSSTLDYYYQGCHLLLYWNV